MRRRDGKDHRYRPGDDELRGGRDGGRQAHGHHEPGGQPPDAVRGGDSTTRATGWSGRWPSVRRSRTRPTPSTRSSASWAGSSRKSRARSARSPTTSSPPTTATRGSRSATACSRRRRSRRSCCASSRRPPRRTWARRSSRAVITVPAYFNDAQRQATKDAGQIAGLRVERIVNEPTAAALAYGLDSKKDETIAVFDFGGGTFDISILEVGDGVVEVKSTNGDTHLGGDDLDQRLIEWIIDRVPQRPGDRPVARTRWRSSGSRRPRRRPSASCRRRPRPRSTSRSSRPTRPAPSTCRCKLNRAKFEQLVDDLLQRTLDPCRQRPARCRPRSRATSTRSCSSAARRAFRASRRWCSELFRREPHKGVNPDEVVAIGAAVQAGVLGGDVKDILLLDVTPLQPGHRDARWGLRRG